jgi:ABC-type antimicrobial peptide transport system permease subunit
MNSVLYALKDLKNQKLKTIMGIVGVSVSVFLLATVSMLTDTVSANYVDFLTIDSGNIDIDIHRRWLAGGQQNAEEYFNYAEMIETIIDETGGGDIGAYIPRVVEVYSINVSNSNQIEWFYFVGLNVSFEKEINFGQIAETDYDFETYGIPKGNCAISLNLAEKLSLSTGDMLNISRGRLSNLAANSSQFMNLTISAVFTPNLKFPASMEDLVIIDLEDIPYSFNLGGDNFGDGKLGKSNHLYLTLANSNSLYDVRNIAGSETRIDAIGADIQFSIGYSYWVDLPKLEELGGAEDISILTSILFVFIGLISMLISVILIAGILSTAVEERIREFGIFRCLGAYKTFNLKLIITEGILICVGGTTLGLFLSILVVSTVVIPLISTMVPQMGFLGSMNFTVQPTTVIYAYAIGVGIGVLVSISPAIKVMRMEIVQAIDPYRHEENLYKLIRESRVNYKIILMGILMAVNGGVVFFLIPRLMLSVSISLLINTFIIILLVFLVGLTMAGIGLMPILLRLWMSVFAPFTKKLINLIKVTIFRYQRRNSTTILMFSLSFSFVIFTSSLINIQTTQISALIEFNQGSNIILYSTSGAGLENPTVELQELLMQIEGIESSSVVIANPNQLSEIYAADGKEFGAEIGDYLNFKSNDINLYGVDDHYFDTTYRQYVVFSQGGNEALDTLFNGNNTCIISEALSSSLSLRLNDIVRITFIRGDEQSFEEFEIVGVSPALPGFPSFKSDGSLGSGEGVLISSEKYIEYMSIPDPAWVNRIFISVTDEYKTNPREIIESIEEKLEPNWNFWVFNIVSIVSRLKTLFVIVEIILGAILSMTIIICMFGLFSASYSSILERKREIGILRALGANNKGIGSLFTIEAFIIMLSAGSVGIIVGFSSAALLSENLTLFTGSPRLLTVPWVTIVMLFSISSVVLYIGMKLLLKNVKKKNLIEIFRETT